MSKELERFQKLLRELFQFDSADLDFGIYRILNARRDLFEDWIESRLPEKVRAALSKGVVKEDAGLAERLRDLSAKLLDEQEDDAVIDGDGRLRDDIKGKTAKEYRALWQARRETGDTGPSASEAEIYNRLYDFFRRYYDDGDFLSLRRYGADNAYAVPYNGEEVLLHWANKDQYYIKTGEHFTDYRFRAGDKADAWHVEFKLTRAESDRDNTKATDKRFFFFDHANTDIDADIHTLTIPVVYRAATTAESETLGSRNQQDALNAEAATRLLGKQKIKAQPVLAGALAQDISDEGNEPQTLLARQLRRYTRRNTSDFFLPQGPGRVPYPRAGLLAQGRGAQA
jgi:adenine-specific DNA-methyltransferase